MNGILRATLVATVLRKGTICSTQSVTTTGYSSVLQQHSLSQVKRFPNSYIQGTKEHPSITLPYWNPHSRKHSAKHWSCLYYLTHCRYFASAIIMPWSPAGYEAHELLALGFPFVHSPWENQRHSCFSRALSSAAGKHRACSISVAS